MTFSQFSRYLPQALTAQGGRLSQPSINAKPVTKARNTAANAITIMCS
jgi:hypothetical protein